jgi:hypothetical protein
MSVEIAFLIAVALAIAMSFGPYGIGYLVSMAKSKLMQLRKTKTDHTA